MGYSTFGFYEKNNGKVQLAFHDCNYDYISKVDKPNKLTGNLTFYVESELGWILADNQKIELSNKYFTIKKIGKDTWKAKTTILKLEIFLKEIEVSDVFGLKDFSLENIDSIGSKIKTKLNGKYLDWFNKDIARLKSTKEMPNLFYVDIFSNFWQYLDSQKRNKSKV